MNVQIAAKKMQINQSFNDYAENKLKKLDRFFGEEGDARITLSSIRELVTIELTVRHENLIFRAEQSAHDKSDALDACIDRIIRQIRKNKTKVEKRLNVSAFKETFSDEVTEQSDFKVIKKKQFVLRPMSVEEAILQMNMLGHSFFMFKNAENGETCVVYSRADGNYSLLEPSKD